ncbi:MAG: leucine-rich repeat domain-containing protein, partial [Flammeovirgaceae bacterium]|nr:leucine-rich repeat domain-containing protein [Flammeovirgaceae bacterium]MDW8288844.1 leucine-rich repeat domain-containing protein [Flammeovirgaceae bacterium]
GSLEVEDADELDEHRLSLVAGLGDDDNDKFLIVGEELRTKVRLDYKVQRVFKIRVRAEDELGEFIEEIFTLTMLPPTLSSQDSLTLVELNQFLKSKLPWVGNIPIHEWQGVRIEENKLVGLNLSGFSLDTISVEVLRKLDELEELDISGNALDFHDLLPIKTLDIDRLTYSPQKEIGQRRELFIALQADNESIVLHANPAQPVGSQYQWLRNEEVMVDRSGKIEGSQTSSLVIKEAEEEDGGIFVCEVIHPDLPALKLRTQPLIINLHQFLLLQDSLALVAIRELFPSRVGGRSEDWTQGYASTWKGVRVRRNRVIGLDLSGRQMKGNFPKEVGNLTALRRLNLFGNQLTGLPKEIGELKQLEYLDLDGNQLKEIPAELFTLDKINTLWLA